MRQAICQYAQRAGEKLRQERQFTRHIGLFIKTFPFVEGEVHYGNVASEKLLLPSVTRAKEAGLLVSGTDVQALARFFHSFEIGLSTEARDGATGKELDAAVSTAMKTWDADCRSVD